MHGVDYGYAVVRTHLKHYGMHHLMWYSLRLHGISIATLYLLSCYHSVVSPLRTPTGAHSPSILVLTYRQTLVDVLHLADGMYHPYYRDLLRTPQVHTAKASWYSRTASGMGMLYTYSTAPSIGIMYSSIYVVHHQRYAGWVHP